MPLKISATNSVLFNSSKNHACRACSFEMYAMNHKIKCNSEFTCIIKKSLHASMQREKCF